MCESSNSASSPLQFLKSCTLATWGALFKHEVLSKDAVIVQMAVKYLKVSMTNLVKVRLWCQCGCGA